MRKFVLPPLRRALQTSSYTLVALSTLVALTYGTIPAESGHPTRFDVVVVLGSPAQPDGTPSFEERERVLEGVREMRRTHTAFLLLTGGAAHGPWVESDVMAQVATRAGVPETAILRERQATNTLQNVYYTRRLMQQRGWNSAEFVSSPSHTPRVALILEHYPMEWRTVQASWPPEYSRRLIASHIIYEVAGTTMLRWFGFRPTPFLPAGKAA